MTLTPAAYIVVGNEDADPAVGEVVRIDDDGVVLLRVVPGTVEDKPVAPASAVES